MSEYDTERRAREKQASRDRDASMLASGEVTREHLRRENYIFFKLRAVAHFDDAEPLK